MTIKNWIDRRFYPEFRDRWDNALFRKIILRNLKPDHQVLDLGAGAGIIPELNLRGRAKTVVGLDPNPKVSGNPYLDSAHVGFAESLPFGAESFDLIVSANVFEHLPDPGAALRELNRVLKPGGTLLIKTPNLWHYVAVTSRMTPYWFHRFVQRMRGGRGEDVFPTVYRANTPATLRSLAQHAGLEVVSLETYEGRPEYLRMLWPLYCLGILYERTVNRFRALQAFRVIIIATLQKPAATTSLSTPESSGTHRDYIVPPNSSFDRTAWPGGGAAAGRPSISSLRQSEQ